VHFVAELTVNRPRHLLSLSFVSDFGEITLRTYIDNNNKKGLYFLSIESEKFLSAFIAKSVSGLPYERQRFSKRYSIKRR